MEMTFELGLEGWLGFPWEQGGGAGRELKRSHLTQVGKLGMRGGDGKQFCVLGASVQVAGDEAGEVGGMIFWCQLAILKDCMQNFSFLLTIFKDMSEQFLYILYFT